MDALPRGSLVFLPHVNSGTGSHTCHNKAYFGHFRSTAKGLVCLEHNGPGLHKRFEVPNRVFTATVHGLAPSITVGVERADLKPLLGLHRACPVFRR